MTILGVPWDVALGFFAVAVVWGVILTIAFMPSAPRVTNRTECECGTAAYSEERGCPEHDR